MTRRFNSLKHEHFSHTPVLVFVNLEINVVQDNAKCLMSNINNALTKSQNIAEL